MIVLVFFTGLGLIAGLNIIIRSQTNGYEQNIPSVPVTQSTQDSQMVSEEPYIVSTTTTVISAQPETIAPIKTANQISAAAYLVGNVRTGKIYLSSGSTQVLPVASMSKLITAIVSTNTLSPTTTIVISPANMDVASDTSNLIAGEKFTLKELLQPLLLSSSNVAAEAIASTDGGPEFMKLMSSISWEVGMPTAYFADPSGIDPENHASARDMFALSRYLYTFRPDILSITRTPHTVIATTTDHGSHVIDSTHPFVSDPRFIGGKTGRTPEAGETMLTMLNINNQPIAFIVLHSAIGERTRDTDILINKFEALGL